MIFALTLTNPLRAAPYTKEKKYIEEQTNTYRQLYGLNPLKRNKELDKAAQAHADRMSQKNFFDHVDPYDNSAPVDRVKRTQFKPYLTCENIYTCSEQDNMGHMAFSGWQVSDGHNENLKRAGVNCQGIGCAMAKKAVNGFVMWYACHVFDNDKTLNPADLAKKPLIPLEVPVVFKHIRHEYHVLAVKELKAVCSSMQEYKLNNEFARIAKNQINAIKSKKLKESDIQKSVEKAISDRRRKVVVIFQKFDTYQPPKRVFAKELSPKNKNKLKLISKEAVGVAIDLSETGTFYFCLVAISV